MNLASRCRLPRRPWRAHALASLWWTKSRPMSNLHGPRKSRPGDSKTRRPRVKIQPSVSITPSWMSDKGSKVTLIGSLSNFCLVGVKAGAGAISGSSAMISDAAHSLGDLLSDVVTLGALHIASKPPDEDHPYGHGKFESIGALAVSAMLLATGAGVGAHSIDSLSGMVLEPSSGLSSMSTYHGLELGAAAAAAAGSILVKEWLYRLTHRVGSETGSPVLLANAQHHRSDVLSSVVALGGIFGTLGGLPWLDPVAGIVVSLMILRSGFDVGFEATQHLTDSTDSDLVERVSNIMRAFVAEDHGVRDFSHLRAQRHGADALVDMHIIVDPMLTVSAAHVLAELVRHKVVCSISEVVDVTVHVDPEIGEDELSQEGLRSICDEIVKRETEGERKDRVTAGPKQVEEVVRKTILTKVSDVLDVTHVAVHVFKTGVTTEVTIEVHPKKLVMEASSIAAATREVVEEISGVKRADIHLELEDE